MEYHLEPKFKKGDYVLATKYSDGDPRDHFVVGYFRDMTWHGRFNVIDDEGDLFRHNGFRRMERIPKQIGLTLIKEMDKKDTGSLEVNTYSVALPNEDKNISKLKLLQKYDDLDSKLLEARILYNKLIINK